jgi:hypothetical protein
MRSRRLWVTCASLLLFALLLAVPTGKVFAHGNTTVGGYTLEIGFKNEPALQDEMNGLDLTVTDSKTDQPISGLENSLQAEIIFGASRKVLAIEAVEGQAGAYTTPVMPTAVGDYTWRIFGKIKDTPIDIRMTSSPTTFGSVVPRSDFSFPASEPAAAALAAALVQANRQAQIAILAGAAGILIGLAGLATAILRRGRNG